MSLMKKKYKTGNPHILEYTGDTDDPLVEQMLKRLKMAIADPDTLHALLVEQQNEEDLALYQKNMKRLAEVTKAKENLLNELKTIEIEKQRIEVEKQQAVAEKQKIEVEKTKIEEENKVMLSEIELLKTNSRLNPKKGLRLSQL